MTIHLALVGLGKIARDQHLPALARNDDFRVSAIVSRNASLPDVPSFATMEALLASPTPCDAVALCTPPQVRQRQALSALAAGKHVLLEKPPGATLSELAPLVALAQEGHLTLFASWHSRFAAAVEDARRRLVDTRISSVHIDWKEDVRVWHPGQSWIFDAGGLGVFDPGINALSILTRILPSRVFVTAAELAFPSNRDAPIAATVSLRDETGTPITAEFDFRQTGTQLWTIRIETADGTFVLADGGATLTQNGRTLTTGENQEYPALYAHFATLLQNRECDIDVSPLILVADAFLIGRRLAVDPFEE